MTMKNVSRHCQLSPGKQNQPQTRAIGLILPNIPWEQHCFTSKGNTPWPPQPCLSIPSSQDVVGTMEVVWAIWLVLQTLSSQERCRCSPITGCHLPSRHWWIIFWPWLKKHKFVFDCSRFLILLSLMCCQKHWFFFPWSQLCPSRHLALVQGIQRKISSEDRGGRDRGLERQKRRGEDVFLNISIWILQQSDGKKQFSRESMGLVLGTWALLLTSPRPGWSLWVSQWHVGWTWYLGCTL
jgi:hypothetical protein